MTTAIGFEASSAFIATEKIFVPEFGVLEAGCLDLLRKRFQGRVYKLSADSIKAISEALGFSARYEQASVRTAIADISQIEAKITFEISRNTKPADVGLRYSRDKWSSTASLSSSASAASSASAFAASSASASAASTSASDSYRHTRTIESIRPWLSTEYTARALPEKSLKAIAEQARVKPDDLSRMFVRVNLKDMTVTLIAEEGQSAKLPTGSYASFALPGGIRQVDAVSTTPVDDEQRRGQNKMPEHQSTSGSYLESVASGSAKYATYSRSEVDQLLKQQIESASASLSQKVNQQTRSVKDALDAQTRAVNASIDEALSAFQSMKKEIEMAEKANSAETMKFIEKLKKDLADEMARTQSEVAGTARSNLKAMDESVKRIEALVERSEQPKKEERPPLFWAVVAVGLLSLANTIILFVRH